MRIKVTEKARELYATNCPISTLTCDTFAEFDYKIQRCIDLGNKKKSSKDTYLIQYFNNQFQVKNNKVVNIQKTKKCFDVLEKLKIAHYNKTFKVVV